ncbi:gamma-glutamyltransferase family protein [Allobranchiibius sp. CTAmp26]|uniref:gamma-glutamyltransferase family protein n=1 Tax=Allobranchiibius sp. CTAmp26 TaxID=2815214 RepID=UPI001AA19727|nr:gamma-glutamyltransferase [Allobranchiibius sp. CTAmp26]MBO1755512.1 gamma-glutamyltransferase [Allobranchiibius sp. CTAmp26]
MFTTRPTLEGTFGAVSSTHWIASQVAMRILEQDGNAFDAAAAAGFVLHVAEPHLNGPGGESPAIISTASDPVPRVLAGQGPAPAGATIKHYTSLGFDLIPGSGLLAATVPGAVDAWLLLLRDHGTKSLKDILEPAISYAARGIPVLERVTATVESVRDLFEQDWTTSAALWLPGGQAPQPGTLHSNPAYARTLQRLVEEGRSAGADREAQIDGARRAWSSGFVAEAVDAFVREPQLDSSGRRNTGVLTGSDMSAYEAQWESPVTADWQGVTVAKVGAWSQGPLMLQTLRLLDALGDPSALDPGTTHGIHSIAESMKLAFADREAWYGDVDDVPIDTLLSPFYAAERAGLIGDRASEELRPGSPDGRAPKLAAYLSSHARMAADARDATLGEPTVDAKGVTRGDTCHVDVVDRWGNMISATPSGGWLQSSPTIPQLGFALGSRLQMLWLEEGLPTSLHPGRRPRTTLTPTLVLREGRPVLACGSPGGDQQEQWQLLFLLRHLVGGQTLQEAIDAPAWHTESFPGSFFPREMAPASLVVEDRLPGDVKDALSSMGHRVREAGPWALGRMCAVSRDTASGIVRAAANPRGMQGYACGR